MLALSRAIRRATDLVNQPRPSSGKAALRKFQNTKSQLRFLVVRPGGPAAFPERVDRPNSDKKQATFNPDDIPFMFPPAPGGPFEHVLADFSETRDMDVEMLLMMQEALMGAISGRGPLRCSSEFLSTWATIVKECFPDHWRNINQQFLMKAPDHKALSLIVTDEMDLKKGKWDTDIKHILWTASCMFGSLSRAYVHTSHIAYNIYRTIEQANCDYPPPGLIERFEDDLYLPTYKELSEAFDLRLPAPENLAHRTTNLTQYFIKRKSDGLERTIQINGGTPKYRHPPSPKTIELTSVADTFQLLDFMEVNCHPFNYFCHKYGHYFVLTQEVVRELADYLRKRAQELNLTNPVVLEVGAGNGRLTHFLNKLLPFQTVAVDWRKWDTPTAKHVQVMDQAEAIQKLKPDIVIAAFIPSGLDWPEGWRKVKEYILIGETTSGAVANSWNTFGEKRGAEPFDDELEDPPFVKDGWQKTLIEPVSNHVIECYDSSELFGRACAVSFTKKNI